MIIATANGFRADDGSPVTTVIMGFDDATVHRLREGAPVKVDGRLPMVGIPMLDLVILVGRTEVELARTLRLQGAEVAEQVPVEQPVAGGNLVRALRTAGIHLVYGPNPDELGRFPCADCGERIEYEPGDSGILIHLDTGVHGCRFGQGCAHVATEIPVIPNQGGTTP